MIPVCKLIIPVYPSPKGSRDNQFASASWWIGLNELIFSN